MDFAYSCSPDLLAKGEEVCLTNIPGAWQGLGSRFRSAPPPAVRGNCRVGPNDQSAESSRQMPSKSWEVWALATGDATIP